MSLTNRATPIPDAGPRIRVHGLTVTQDDPVRPRTLLSDVSFTVDGGQSLAVVGESGSGKSLTVRAALGLLPPGLTAFGEVVIDGHRVDNDPRTRRAQRGRVVSLLMQDPFTLLNPLRQVGKQIADGLMHSSAARRSAAGRAQEVARRLAEVGLPAEIGQRYPFQLSGGMRQRVGVAAALAGDPRVLITDEPTTALDVTTQREVLALIRSIQRERGMAFVLITHDLRVAFSMCDQILVLYAGRVMETGATAAVRERQLHPYTHGLLRAEPPVDRRLAVIPTIPGSVPAHDDVIDCCAFGERCALAQERCQAGRPVPVPVSPGRSSACIRVADLPETDSTPADPTPVAATIAKPGGVIRPRPALVQVTALRKAFSGTQHPALDGVDLTVGPGEAVAIVGESGSGKTTLARCLVGLERPDAGQINIGGIDCADYARLSRNDRIRVRRLTQMVFQDPYSTLNPVLTIGATLREALRCDGLPADRQAVADLLATVGLPAEMARMRPAGLSGGERQRVAIARAIAGRPRLLICDEPVSALDVSVQAQVLTLLGEVRERFAMAMLFITHDLAVVRQVADHVYVLRAGECVESGPTGDVLDHAHHPYTRKLLLSVPNPDRDWL
ncbi:ABC transporter ATP-binding protein [Micromonospora sp. CPCC 206060]|uniref:ABC transporter ATP-binding protein n=1 Tax=Micromonospora sp. CPCC 206060 TaxID=3122406 RepID=UPI002FF343BE